MSFFLFLLFFGSLNVFCCDGCEVGYYGESCSDACPNFCHNNECNVTSGKCLSCMGGYYSDNNQECSRCPDHCTACNSNHFCFACTNGFKGNICGDLCTNCQPGTSCDKQSGYCFENCSEGLSGELCDIQCDFKCKSCYRFNKQQCISCADDEKGIGCKEECFNRCLKRTCYESHGVCTFGCSSGYWGGETCNKTCLSFCKNSFCNITCKEIEPTVSPNIGFILGPVIGFIGIITACIVVCILKRRRCTKRNNCCNRSGSDKEVQYGTSANDGSNVHLVENTEVNLFVKGLNPCTRAKSIQTFFEEIGRPAKVKDRILFNIERTEALVIFQQKPDMISLEQSVRARKLDEFSLEICEMPPPRAILVSHDGKCNREIIVNYFEKEYNGGGTLKKNDEVETEDGCCLLEFEDPTVVPRLCSGVKHRVDGVPLKVSPYYQCKNGAIWDMKLHGAVPKPVKIQILPDQLEFVIKHFKPHFTALLRDKQADITFFNDYVIVKPNLLMQQNQAWEIGIKEAVARFLNEHIEQTELIVPEQIWDKLKEFLKSGTSKFVLEGTLI